MENLKRAVVEPRARTDNANAMGGASRGRGNTSGKISRNHVFKWNEAAAGCRVLG